MTDKDKPVVGPGTVDIDGETLHTSTVDIDGVLHTIRELTIDEGDAIGEQSTQPDKSINFRLQNRLTLAKALVTPVVSADQVGKWGARRYAIILREFNNLNSIPESNPTLPAG